MSDHYYSHNPQVESNPQAWNFTLRQNVFHFKTDAGVFSKREVDFGSRLLIEAFELNVEVKGPILDVGCGYGPMGLAIAKSYPERKVEMIDVNERAVFLAQENARVNQVDNTNIYISSLFDRVEEKLFAAILTNPPIRAGKIIVHEILEKSVDHLTKAGELWVVIQKKQGAPSAIEKMKQVYGNVEIIVKKKGYYVIKSKKN